MSENKRLRQVAGNRPSSASARPKQSHRVIQLGEMPRLRQVFVRAGRPRSRGGQSVAFHFELK